MRAIWTTGTNGPDSLEVRETADPEPEPGQGQNPIRAAGLCFAEVMAAQGLYPGAPGFPAVLGYEAAGDAHRRILSHGNTGKIILTP